MTGDHEQLALYYYPSCGFCRRVMRVIDQLGVEVELRDIWENRQHRVDLMAATGRQTVPVLRCTSSTRDQWLAESRDIIAHLESRFG